MAHFRALNIARTERLLDNTFVNSPANDYHAYGRTMPGFSPPLFGQQYKLAGCEAHALIAGIESRYTSIGTKRGIIRELYKRSLDRVISRGSVALDQTAAQALSDYAKTIRLNYTFGFGQTPNPHPVG